MSKRPTQAGRTGTEILTGIPHPGASGSHPYDPTTEVGSKWRRYLRQARALWRDFTGESAYERYVERHRREHPDHEPMSEREFWRACDDFAESNVRTGWC